MITLKFKLPVLLGNNICGDKFVESVDFDY